MNVNWIPVNLEATEQVSTWVEIGRLLPFFHQISRWPVRAASDWWFLFILWWPHGLSCYCYWSQWDKAGLRHFIYRMNYGGRRIFWWINEPGNSKNNNNNNSNNMATAAPRTQQQSVTTRDLLSKNFNFHHLERPIAMCKRVTLLATYSTCRTASSSVYHVTSDAKWRCG